MQKSIGYKEIFETIRRDILTGKYADEGTLPSEIALARRFKVCRPTVSHAMQELAMSGLVVRRKGAPTTLTRFAQNASGYIGLVIQGRWTEDDLYPRISRRLSDLAERSGWKMVRCEIVATSKRGRLLEIKRIVDRLTAEHVTGVYFQPVECISKSDTINKDIVVRFRKAGIHVVLLDYDIVGLPGHSSCDLVGVDNFAAGYELGCHLVGRGFRRVAFLKLPFAAPSVEDRMRGVACAMLERTGRWDPSQSVVVCDPTDVVSLRRKLMGRSPQAIVAYNDRAAVQLLESLRSIKRLRNALVVGFDDIPVSETNDPPITTMRQDVACLAELAFHALVTRIRNPKLPPRKILLPCKLVVR